MSQYELCDRKEHIFFFSSVLQSLGIWLGADFAIDLEKALKLHFHISGIEFENLLELYFTYKADVDLEKMPAQFKLLRFRWGFANNKYYRIASGNMEYDLIDRYWSRYKIYKKKILSIT